LRLVSVGSKRFLTNKVDRSVTGLVVQQQCVGPNQLTLADYGVVAHSHFSDAGTAMSLGEQPIKGLVSPQAMARLAVAEALLNLAGAKITDIKEIRCSANWMLAAKLPGEGAWLVDAAQALCDICLKAPGELVIGMYAPMDDVECKVTPDLKRSGHTLWFIDLSDGKNCLGGSALAQAHSQLGDSCPDVCEPDLLKRTFETLQELICGGHILSLHDRSDGGLITTLLEMAFAGNVGLEINLADQTGDPLPELFSEGPGLVIETTPSNVVSDELQKQGIPLRRIGYVGSRGGEVIFRHQKVDLLREPMVKLRDIWESTSTAIDSLQADPKCVAEEAWVNRRLIQEPPYGLSFYPQATSEAALLLSGKPKVAILREQGSNGDREMAAAFLLALAGFEPWDVTMTDLLAGDVTLDQFRGIAFVGGFSFADVLGAGRGWAGVILHNDGLRRQFEKFYERLDTFSLGVCNGCQLMALLNWVPGFGTLDSSVRFDRNTSGRFESRFSTVRIMDSPSIMLRRMAGSCLGVWIAHGEGRLSCEPNDLAQITVNNLASIRYADPDGDVTQTYPFNPNGSPDGIAALCSPNGRHLAMMPHPERTFLLRQWPWLPAGWEQLAASPWLRLFQNAYKWCLLNGQ